MEKMVRPSPLTGAVLFAILIIAMILWISRRA
jgi:hypothetical protein